MVKSLEFISFSSLITHCKNIQITQTQKQNRGRSKPSTLRRHSPNPVRTLRCFFWFGVVWVLRWYHLSQSLKLTSSRELPLISSPPASSSLPSTGVTGVSPFQVFPVLGIKTEPCVWLASTLLTGYIPKPSPWRFYFEVSLLNSCSWFYSLSSQKVSTQTRLTIE